MLTLSNILVPGPIDHDGFIAAYNGMGGSPKKGTELFTKLTSDGETVSYSDINDKNHVLDVFGECY